jgi:hypothetical protein
MSFTALRAKFRKKKGCQLALISLSKPFFSLLNFRKTVKILKLKSNVYLKSFRDNTICKSFSMEKRESTWREQSGWAGV